MVDIITLLVLILCAVPACLDHKKRKRLNNSDPNTQKIDSEMKNNTQPRWPGGNGNSGSGSGSDSDSNNFGLRRNTRKAGKMGRNRRSSSSSSDDSAGSCGCFD